MTSRAKATRLERLNDTIAGQPVSTKLARAAFERFKATGELPDDDRLTWAVIQRVALGYEMVGDGDLRFEPMEVLAERLKVPPRKHDEVMDSLMLEAVSPHEIVRHAARLALCRLAAFGVDVTSTPFHGHDLDLPEHGSVATHLLGLDKLLFRRPHQRQARSAFSRLDELHERLDARPEALAKACRAAERFQRDGDLPDDDLVLDAMLAMGELATLAQHAAGVDVSRQLACFEEIAGAGNDAERMVGIAKLQEMAVAGLL